MRYPNHTSLQRGNNSRRKRAAIACVFGLSSALLGPGVILAGCGGGSNTIPSPLPTPTPTPTPTPATTEVAVTISPVAVTLFGSGSTTFTASVSNVSDQSVTWRVAEGSSGGTVTSDGVYTAPTTAGTYHVVATSVADATKTAVATVTVQSGSQTGATVTVSPTDASLSIGASQTFTASVTGVSDTSVTWRLREGSNGGTITSAGVYTAPSTPGTYHIIATSTADSTAAGVATVIVQAGGGAVTLQ